MLISLLKIEFDFKKLESSSNLLESNSNYIIEKY